MTGEFYSAAHLDYLQRTGRVSMDQLTSPHRTAAPPELRRLWRIAGVGRVEKRPIPTSEMNPHMLTEDVLIGLYGNKIPLAFLVYGEPGEAAVHLGTWLPTNGYNTDGKTNHDGQAILDERQEMLTVALSSLYPSIRLEPADVIMARLPLSGFALGVPTTKPADQLEGALPIDRLIRALAGVNWACLILAEPVLESVTANLRNALITEMRVVQAAVQAERGPSPLIEHYSELLRMILLNLTSGVGVGTWRTAVYLLGDRGSYYRLASIWRGIFSGEESIPEPVRVWDAGSVGALAAGWAMPDAEGERGPGYYHRPLQYQTLLTSTQLAAYIHLPQVETSGFTVSFVPQFDAVPPPARDDDVVNLGRVVIRERPIEKTYQIGLGDLSSHTFVAGITGGGKTTTIKHLLTEANKFGVPFLVIEPAKAEYRSLLSDPRMSGPVQVFTLGNERISPFRLNPFEVPEWPETSVGVHLDLLRSAFTASFGMWTPLPQVLEQCLHRIYEDRGWDITANQNYRLDDNSDVAASFPTLSDLACKIDEVTKQLGYDDKVTADIRAALLTRINGLRAGGKGRMLDVQRSLPMESLLRYPTIIELEGMGDDDDKAFIMGLLITRLVEFRRAQSKARAVQNGQRAAGAREVDGLKHLLVIEEAHRLLANVQARSSAEEADPRGKAVETFANLLSEIRAYGQGVIVADQIPVKLTPDVIKNTSLKIAHRIVSADDREVMAGAMAMDDRQMHALAMLDRGHAAVFSQGDDAPVLVQVPEPKARLHSPDDTTVAQHMSSIQTMSSHRALFEPLAAYVDLSKPGAAAARDAARDLANDPGFQRDFVRLLVSITEEHGELDRLWEGLLSREKAVRQNLDEKLLQRCLLIYAAQWFVSRRGRQHGWSYAQTSELELKLRELLLARLERRAWPAALGSFRDFMHRLHHRSFEPYAGCAKICKQDSLCLYRHSIGDQIAISRERRLTEWKNAYNEGGPRKIWGICERQASQLIELHPSQREAMKRIGLCYAQQMLADCFSEDHEVILQQLLDEANPEAR